MTLEDSSHVLETGPWTIRQDEDIHFVRPDVVSVNFGLILKFSYQEILNLD
jgi:hypothetical protein